jgi:aminopeptidase N
VIQTQDLSNTPIYTLPVSIEIWQGGEKHVHNIIIEDQAQQFAFALSDSLDFVVFDSEQQLVAEINYPREREELFKQYELADGGMSRLDALQNMLQDTVVDQRLVETMLTALEDKFWPIRQLSVNLFREYQGPYYDQLVETLTALAEQDPKTTVQADALTTLSSLENTAPFKDLFLKAAGAKSYAVSGSGLTAFLQSDVTGKLELAESYESATNINVVLPLADYYALDQVPNKYNWFSSKLETSQGELLYYLVNYFGQYLIKQPQEQQMEGAKLLEGYGLDHPVYYIRFSAFQALSLLEEVPGVAEIKQRIRTQEKDPRLLQVYQQMP